MRLVVFFTVAFISLAFATLPPPIPIGTPYNALSTPAYSTQGQITAFIILTANGQILQNITSSSKLGIDPANSRFAADIGALGKQYTFANGTYEVLFQTGFPVCYYYPEATFAEEKARKAQALKFGETQALLPRRRDSIYFGFVGDAGAGDTRVAFSTTVNRDDLPEQYFFGQYATIPATYINGTKYCPEPHPLVLNALVDLPDIENVVPPASFFQLPPQCYGPERQSWLDSFCFGN